MTSREDAPRRAGRRGRPAARRVHRGRTPTAPPASCTGPSRCCCVDAAGRVLLQQRAAVKTRFPLRWANSCCGHPAPGEALAVAANRRLREELGIAGRTADRGRGVRLPRRGPGDRTGRVRVRPRPARRGSTRRRRCARSGRGRDLTLGVTRAARDRARRARGPVRTLARRGGRHVLAAGLGPARAVSRRTSGPRSRSRGLAGTQASGRVDRWPAQRGAVARRLGVAVTTLRTWHQRYGLGPSQHEPGPPPPLHASGPRAAGDHAAAHRRGGRARPRRPAGYRAAPRPRRRSVGGRRGRTPATVRPAVRGLPRAALRLDAPAIRQLVAQAVAATRRGRRLGRGAAPGADRHRRAARRHRRARRGGAPALPCVSAVLAAVAPATRRPGPLRILLACADEEQHSLPLEALAAALAAAGVPTRMLGARVPPRALPGRGRPDRAGRRGGLVAPPAHRPTRPSSSAVLAERPPAAAGRSPPVRAGRPTLPAGVGRPSTWPRRSAH